MRNFYYISILLLITCGFNTPDDSVPQEKNLEESINVYNEILPELFDKNRISNPSTDLLISMGKPDSSLLRNPEFHPMLIEILSYENQKLKEYLLKRWSVLLTDSLIPPIPQKFIKSESMTYKYKIDSAFEHIYNDQIDKSKYYKIRKGMISNLDKYKIHLIDSIPKYKYGESYDDNNNYFFLRLSTGIFNKDYTMGLFFVGFYTYPNNWGTGHWVYVKRDNYTWRILKTE